LFGKIKSLSCRLKIEKRGKINGRKGEKGKAVRDRKNGMGVGR